MIMVRNVRGLIARKQVRHRKASNDSDTIPIRLRKRSARSRDACVRRRGGYGAITEALRTDRESGRVRHGMQFYATQADM
jgi:hypothetical protein